MSHEQPARASAVDPTSLVAVPPPNLDVEPEPLDLGGEEAFPLYVEAFERLVILPGPMITPRGHEVVVGDHAARHLCFCQDRSHRHRQRGGDHREIRDKWRQSAASAISMLRLALVYPNEIHENNQEPGNEVHLLAFPGNNLARPRRRYYVSLKPISGGRRLLKTAFPCDQQYWDNARRTKAGIRWRRPGSQRY